MAARVSRKGRKSLNGSASHTLFTFLQVWPKKKKKTLTPLIDHSLALILLGGCFPAMMMKRKRAYTYVALHVKESHNHCPTEE